MCIKGALIGMCIDIIIREKSNGERGILDLMQKLSNEFVFLKHLTIMNF
jgi:predicted metalloprotease with PDZ domain